jgi:hypothetical protein
MAKQPVELQSIISDVYQDLKDRLLTLRDDGVLRTVYRWNNQLADEKMEYSVVLPAVYLELLPIPWDYANWELRKGPIVFRLHQCLQATDNFETQDWEFNQKILERLQGKRDGKYDYVSINELTNHNYNVWIDNMTDYRTFVLDETLFKLRNTGEVSTLSETVEGEI